MNINGNGKKLQDLQVEEVFEKITKTLAEENNNLEDLNKIRLPTNFNQDNCFLRCVTTSGENYYLDYSIQFGFPVSKFMNKDKTAEYALEYYEPFCPKDGIPSSVENPTMYVAMKPEHIDALIFNNKAGPKGECVTWNEILDLYGGDVFKEKIPVPVQQNSENNE